MVFEGADLARLECTKATMPGIIQELIFHPDAQLASTWQPWDGVLGPPDSALMQSPASLGTPVSVVPSWAA